MMFQKRKENIIEVENKCIKDSIMVLIIDQISKIFHLMPEVCVCVDIANHPPFLCLTIHLFLNLNTLNWIFF